MKTEGLHEEKLTLEEALRRGIDLPKSMSMWGDYANFGKMDYDKRKINVFLLYYFEDIIGGLIYFEKTSAKLMKRGESPRTNFSVPYAHIYLKEQDSQRAQEQLLKEFFGRVSKIVDRELSAFELSLPPTITDIRELIWSGWKVEPNYTYTLDLDEVKSVGLSEYVGKKVRNIIKYAKLELVVKPISAQDFFSLYKDTYSRQGRKSPKPKVFFDKLSTLDNMYFLGSFLGNRLTSGVVIGEVGDTAYLVLCGNSNELHNTNGNSLLIYDYIEKVLGRNERLIKKFDFAGANDEKIGYFKSNFQPKVQMYFLCKKQKFGYRTLRKVASSKIPFAHLLF